MKISPQMYPDQIFLSGGMRSLTALVCSCLLEKNWVVATRDTINSALITFTNLRQDMRHMRFSATRRHSPACLKRRYTVLFIRAWITRAQPVQSHCDNSSALRRVCSLRSRTLSSCNVYDLRRTIHVFLDAAAHCENWSYILRRPLRLLQLLVVAGAIVVGDDELSASDADRRSQSAVQCVSGRSTSLLVVPPVTWCQWSFAAGPVGATTTTYCSKTIDVRLTRLQCTDRRPVSLKCATYRLWKKRVLLYQNHVSWTL